jgi:hypothetical protein
MIDIMMNGPFMSIEDIQVVDEVKGLILESLKTWKKYIQRNTRWNTVGVTRERRRVCLNRIFKFRVVKYLEIARHFFPLNYLNLFHTNSFNER